MIKFNMEFRKGILFVRIYNKLNKKNYNKEKEEINKIIKNIGIKYIVLNFNQIKINDYFNIKFVINNYNLIKKNKGRLFLCGDIDNKITNKFLNMRIDHINKEIDVFNLVK